ncbi:hypothetical protein HK101_002617 [Irineochytrium annulatum]|nr:hypothetical protein HK101_002617 [Irineochytrium annulatum]
MPLVMTLRETVPGERLSNAIQELHESQLFVLEGQQRLNLGVETGKQCPLTPSKAFQNRQETVLSATGICQWAVDHDRFHHDDYQEALQVAIIDDLKYDLTYNTAEGQLDAQVEGCALSSLLVVLNRTGQLTHSTCLRVSATRELVPAFAQLHSYAHVNGMKPKTIFAVAVANIRLCQGFGDDLDGRLDVYHEIAKAPSMNTSAASGGQGVNVVDTDVDEADENGDPTSETLIEITNFVLSAMDEDDDDGFGEVDASMVKPLSVKDKRVISNEMAKKAMQLAYFDEMGMNRPKAEIIERLNVDARKKMVQVNGGVESDAIKKYLAKRIKNMEQGYIDCKETVDAGGATGGTSAVDGMNSHLRKMQAFVHSFNQRMGRKAGFAFERRFTPMPTSSAYTSAIV